MYCSLWLKFPILTSFLFVFSFISYSYHVKTGGKHALTFFFFSYRSPERAQEGHPWNPAHRAEDLQISFNFKRVCLLRPTYCHLLLQSQAGLLQRQPKGGQLHVSTQLWGLPWQVSSSRTSPLRLLLMWPFFHLITLLFQQLLSRCYII